MSSARKIAANRNNARASTGPKTPAGRARSARNALHHGLSLPITSDPALAADVEALAREIAGPGAEAEIHDLARRVAEAQMDLCRIRTARQRLLDDWMSQDVYDPRAKAQLQLRHLQLLLDGKADTPLPTPETTPAGKFAAILSREHARLAALDRYEGRALSRRKFAIRALDDVRQAKRQQTIHRKSDRFAGLMLTKGQ